ncbi:MAG: hypothetical protein LBJ89_00195 [Holosporales bacterium]|jgi:hypothetical protein|nr:hypothetical protein [Holosporales bacterium]
MNKISTIVLILLSCQRLIGSQTREQDFSNSRYFITEKQRQGIADVCNDIQDIIRNVCPVGEEMNRQQLCTYLNDISKWPTRGLSLVLFDNAGRVTGTDFGKFVSSFVYTACGFLDSREFNHTWGSVLTVDPELFSLVEGAVLGEKRYDDGLLPKGPSFFEQIALAASKALLLCTHDADLAEGMERSRSLPSKLADITDAHVSHDELAINELWNALVMLRCIGVSPTTAKSSHFVHFCEGGFPHKYNLHLDLINTEIERTCP